MTPPLDYRPIHCGFHDRLESLAVRGTRCEVVFRDARGDARTVTTRVLDVFAEGREEFAVLESGEKVRLDRLVSVGGVLRP